MLFTFLAPPHFVHLGIDENNVSHYLSLLSFNLKCKHFLGYLEIGLRLVCS